ncbi:MAG: helix-turn-helix domain-containing protein [Puia sp.]|nr:helix-turn-helix domain-containing protein [Puia sp.]
MHLPIAKSDPAQCPAHAQGANPVEIMHFLSESPEHLALPAQQNEFFVFTWFIRGKGLMTIDFADHRVESNRLFVLQPHTVYALDTLSETSLEGWRLSINGHYLQESGSNLSDLLFELRNIGSLRIPAENTHKLDRLFYFLQTELEHLSPDSAPVVNSYLTILLSEFKKLSKASTTLLKHHDARYDEFIELINRDFRDTRDIETYAAKIHISSKQLNRICKEITGQTAARILETRIHLEASRLLHYTNRSVKEISYELGFGEPSYFIKFYRRISKQTPQQYRMFMSGKHHPIIADNPLTGNLPVRELPLLQLYN